MEKGARMLLIGIRARSVLFVACCGFASICLSVGFGNLKVNSYLNQPLAAEVHLVGTKNIDPFSFQARLASPKDFDRAGIARTAELYHLVFEVTIENDNPVINIKTSESIKSPYLEFLVELAWPEGKLVKNYVILLDKAPKQVKAKPKTTKANKAVSKNVVKKPAPVTKAKKEITNAKIDTALLPNVVPDIDDISIVTDITQHELYKTPVISQTSSVIKTDNKQVSKDEIVTNTSTPTTTAVVQAIVDDVINMVKQNDIEPSKLEPSIDSLENMITAEEIQVTPTVATLIKQETPNLLVKQNHTYLLALLLITTVVATLAIIIRRKYASTQQSDYDSEDLSVTDKFDHIVGYSQLLQLKIDLAKQYIEIDDHSSARDLLSEVIAVANGTQKSEAQMLHEAVNVNKP